MYKMLLVEDEPIVRLAIKSIVNWGKYGFDEILESPNGKKGLEIIKSRKDIDVVITDINMPVMNGIELIKESMNLNINTQFLVLSAYDDYSLVRNAFKLGINDYILKTEIKPEKIVKLVMKTLEGQNKIKQNTSLKLDKDELLKMLLSGKLNKQDLKKQHLKIKYDNYISCCMIIDNFYLVKKRYINNDFNEFMTSVKNAVNQVLETINNGEILAISPKEYAIFFSFDNLYNDKLNKSLIRIINNIRYVLKTFLNIEVTIGISKVNNQINNIKYLFDDAKKNAQLRIIYGKGKNIYPHDAKELNKIRKNKNRNLSQKIIIEMSKENGLLESIDRLDTENCLKEMKKIFSIKKFFITDEFENIYIYYLEIVLMIIEYVIKDDDNNIESIIGKNIDIYDEIKKFETIKEIECWILDLLRKIIISLSKIKNQENYSIIKAKKFIQKNYNKKLTLDMVSKYVGFSKAYFSKIFTEKTGSNFIKYLTNVRIKKAKTLLDKTDMKIYEVCDKTGYPNIEHFSRTFKKIVGLSPLQYKNNHNIRRQTNERII